MGDENPIRTLGDYSKPNHKGCRNTIELPIGNNVVPLRSDTIRLVQNGCSFHELWSEDPNQHLKDFLKLVDSLDLDGSITTWEDLTTRFLAQFFPPGRTAKLRNDILMFQQHQGESLSEAWTRFKDLLQKVPHHGIDLWLQQPVVEIEPQQPEEPRPTLENEFKDLHFNLPVLEVLAHAPIYNAILDKYVESLKLGKNRSAFVQGEIPAKMGDPGLFTLPCRLGDSKPFDTLADLGSCDMYKDVEVHIGKLKLFNDFYVLDMKKDPESPLLVGRGFLATANTVIDCRMAKIAVGEGIFRSPKLEKGNPINPGLAWTELVHGGISRGVELNPFKDTLVFRRMVEFLGAIPINLKCNMWESKDLIKKPINWNKPPKNRDGAWHARIRIIEPDGEEFTKTLQSIPTTRKLSERENPREIIDLDHFYDT
ncbi:MAK10-like protein [Tanacetum coccineum]